MFNAQKDIVELHDDIKNIQRVMLEKREGQNPLLHVSFELRPDRDYEANGDKNIHVITTNGVSVDHHLIPLEYVEPQEPQGKKKGKA